MSPRHAQHLPPTVATSDYTHPPRSNVYTDRPPLPIKREPASASESGSAPSTPALSSSSSLSLSPASSPSLPATPPPSTTIASTSVNESEATAETGTAWQLIPYDVPWGADFLDYAAGTLPGPEGACLFLRSPTPVEKRRAAQACAACRERKAKCSGDRPACARCLEKGHVCVYAPDARKSTATRRRPPPTHAHSHPHPYPRPRHGLPHASSSASSSASYYPHTNYTYPRQASRSRSPKREPSDYSLSPEAGYAPLCAGGHYTEAGYTGTGMTTIHAPRPRRASPLSLPQLQAQTTTTPTGLAEPCTQAAYAFDQADAS
ncbi:hypothetical protein EIP86_011074 [Pleurotus ostreatoroseus]|nr:hypothetical protein EIP86_008889 [Pleurotus ostreatoroseus]KAF7799832.1 hypothetical protein EIP86_011074 [Pleurotus ostreatoroseus]